MESLAKAIIKISSIMAVIGILLGSGIGWGISSIFETSQMWSIIIGGAIGAPAGFFSLVFYSRIKNMISSRNADNHY